MLEIDNIQVQYGPITALRDLSITVNAGELVALIGANGAGKTTTISAVAGVHKPANLSSGSRQSRSCAEGSQRSPKGATSSQV
jgi:ABC-type branched-subunit amino acid transport system ATPase component